MKTYALWKVFPETPEHNYIMAVFTNLRRLHAYLALRGVGPNTYMIQESEMTFKHEGRQWNI